jgi:hypothetical protein
VSICCKVTLKSIWGEAKILYEKKDDWIIDAEEMDTLSDAVAVSVAAQTTLNCEFDRWVSC